MSQILLWFPLLLTGVACESLEGEESRKWGIKHVLLSMLFVVVLVKIKNWIVRARVKSCILRTFEDKADEYLSQFKSRNNLVCHKVKKAMWKDLTRRLKTKAKGNNKSRGRKTLIKYYEEAFDDYFAMLEMERSKGEWAGILRLEQICNQDKLMDLESNVSGEESETSKKDASPDPDLQLNNTDPITLTEPEQNDNISATTLTDDSEEGASMFLEMFETLDESFFAAVMIWML